MTLNIEIRQAKEADLVALVALLSDDVLGTHREDVSSPLNEKYLQAYRHIANDVNNELIVMQASGKVAGMLQLTFIPYLTHIGSWRCLIEGVRVGNDYRGNGLGERLILWAIDRARDKQCNLVQLTSDKTRNDALRFYEKLGFKATHEGFKLSLVNN